MVSMDREAHHKPPDRTLIALGVLVRGAGPDARILLTRRAEGTVLGGFWEFPGGKVDAGESVPQALVREFWEEVGLAIEVGPGLDGIDHDYEHGAIRLQAHFCRPARPDQQPRADPAVIAEHRWVAPHQLPEFRFPPANTPLVHQVMRSLGA